MKKNFISLLLIGILISFNTMFAASYGGSKSSSIGGSSYKSSSKPSSINSSSSKTSSTYTSPSYGSSSSISKSNNYDTPKVNVNNSNYTPQSNNNVSKTIVTGVAIGAGTAAIANEVQKTNTINNTNISKPELTAYEKLKADNINKTNSVNDNNSKTLSTINVSNNNNVIDNSVKVNNKESINNVSNNTNINKPELTAYEKLKADNINKANSVNNNNSKTLSTINSTNTNVSTNSSNPIVNNQPINNTNYKPQYNDNSPNYSYSYNDYSNRKRVYNYDTSVPYGYQYNTYGVGNYYSHNTMDYLPAMMLIYMLSNSHNNTDDYYAKQFYQENKNSYDMRQWREEMDDQAYSNRDIKNMLYRLDNAYKPLDYSSIDYTNRINSYSQRVSKDQKEYSALKGTDIKIESSDYIFKDEVLFLVK